MAARFVAVICLAALAPAAQAFQREAHYHEAVSHDAAPLHRSQAPIAHKAAQPAAALAQKSAQQESTDLVAYLGEATGMRTLSCGAVLAEYLAMTLFVVVGCGSAMGIAKEPGSAWILQVSLTFGLAITALAYAIGAYSGGQINCAVTLGLMLVGQVSIAQGLLNFAGQVLGSVTGAYILCAIFPQDQDRTQGLASNAVSEGFTTNNAFVGEAAMTFLLMFTVLETAVNPNSVANREQAALAIGFAVFLAHCVLIPIDGCSINPTRSFGPAYVAAQRYAKSDAFRDMHVFISGPITGAMLAAAAYGILRAC